MQTKFNHTANASPRSGSSKQAAPVAWFFVIMVAIAVVIWLVVKP